MAVTQENLLIQITANTDKATVAIDGLTKTLDRLDDQLKQTRKAQETSAKSLTDFGFMATKVNAVIGVMQAGFAAASKVMNSTVGEFQKAQAGVQGLADTLAMMGEKNVNASLERFKSLADEIQDTTIVDDDAVIAMAKLGVASGRTDEQIEKMIRTSVDLAAVTGGSVQQSMDALIKSFGGETGELKKLTPELKNLTQAQLMAGGAVDVLSDKFDGFGKASAQTYIGQIEQIKNTLSDAMKEIGHIFQAGFALDEGVVSFSNSLKSIVDALKSNGASIAAIVAEIKQAFMNFVDSVIVAFGFLEVGFGQIGKFIARLKGDFLGMTADEFDQVQNDILARNDEIMSSMKLSATAGEEAYKNYGKAIKETTKVSNKAGVRKESFAIPEQAKASLDELAKKYAELDKQRRLAGKSEYEQISLNAENQLKELDILEQKLRSQRALTAEAQRQLDLSRKAVKEAADSQRGASMQKATDDFAKQREALQRSNQGMFKTELDMAKQERANQIAEIDSKLAELKKQGMLPERGPYTEGQQKILNEAQGAKDAVNAKPLLGRPEEFSAAKDIGDQIGVGITENLSTGMAGVVTGAMSGAMSAIGAAQGAIDMAQSLVDAIPKLLNSFANLVNSITELPLKIAEGMGRVYDAITKFITDFLPNVVKMLDQMIMKQLDFLKNLPKAFATLYRQLPEMMNNLIEKLPEAFQSAIEELIVNLPDMFASQLELMFIKLPKIFIKLTEVLAIRLPVAVWHGIMRGMEKAATEIGKIWHAWMKGRLYKPTMKIELDDKLANQKLANLTKDTNKLFSVSAIAQAAQNADNVIKNVTDAAKKAGRSMWDQFVKDLKTGWQDLMDAGTKLWDGLVKAIGDAAETFGDWGTKIWNGLVQAIGDLAETFGEWGTKIWNGLKQALGDISETFGAWGTAIWNGFIKPVGETFGDWGTKIWNGFLKPVGETFGDWGTKIWNGFIKPIGDTFSKFGSAIIESFKRGIPEILTSVTSLFTNLFETFKKLFTFDFSGLKTSITDAFTAGGAIMRDAFKGVLNPMVDVFNGLIDAINGMKIPSVGWKIDAGYLGKASGTLFPDTDLIPGEIAKIAKFAKGGLVMGQGTRDTVPALLTPGEFVLNRQAVGSLGLNNVVSLNQGRSVGSTVNNVTVNMQITAKDKIDENFLRQRIIPALRDELKRNSLDGRTIVYSAGVRT